MSIFDVFISYRRSDGLKIAEELYEYLTSKGLRVFLDKQKMVDGHYFTSQIVTNLRIAPNYILIATEDVFKFHKKEDWVQKEIEIAVEEYEKDLTERTITVLVQEAVTFPEKDKLPEKICNIADAQRIFLPYGEDVAESFYRTLISVTNINRRNLWFAAHRWLENSKQPSGRFAGLNIKENILPNVTEPVKKQNEMPINVYSKEKQDNKQLLLDAMGMSRNHLYLIGQGGIGKTTALMHIMNSSYENKQYEENAQIPIFVELSFAPDTYGALYEGGKSSFIRRSIYKQVRADRTIKQVSAKEVSDIDEVFSNLPYDVAVQPITDILSKTSPAPEYLLLLDGLNEVSSVIIEETGLSVVQMIMREIDLLLSECPNVRVVLTSRADESDIYNESISRLYLSGLEESAIRKYLEDVKFSKENIDNALKDENLCETLKIPLFLTMYASLSKYDEVSTQGEILKLFFNERRKNISVYTMQDRLAAVEKNVTDIASAVQKNRIDADMQNFILDFILPEIAWSMERNNEFYIRIRDIRKIIEPVLMDTDDLSVCGEFGRELFSKYRNGASAKMHTHKVAKKIFERFGNDMTAVTENIVNCCVFAFGIMQESNSKYGFVHQHIRDYFAAVKNINTLRLSVYLYEEDEKELAFECMNKTFKDESIGHTVRRFIGEYLGEHKNKSYYRNEKWFSGVPDEKCDRSIIKRSLDIYRGYFDDAVGYGVYSLVCILKDVRQDLFGSDFSNLELIGCEFEGYSCNECNFRNSVFSPSSFFPIKLLLGDIDTEAINAVSENGRYVALTTGKNIFVIDTHLNIIISTLGDFYLKNTISIKKIIFIKNKFLVVVFEKSFAVYDLYLNLIDFKIIFNGNISDGDDANILKRVSQQVTESQDISNNSFFKNITNGFIDIFEVEELLCLQQMSEKGFDFISNMVNNINEYEEDSQEAKILKKARAVFYPKENSVLGYDRFDFPNYLNDSFSQAEKLDVFVEEQREDEFSLIVIFDGNVVKLKYYCNDDELSSSSQKLGFYERLKDTKSVIPFKKGLFFFKDRKFSDFAMLETENLGCDSLWFSFESYKLNYIVTKRKSSSPKNAFYHIYFNTDLTGIKINMTLFDYRESIFDALSGKIPVENKNVFLNCENTDTKNKKYVSLNDHSRGGYISNSFFSGNEFYLKCSKADKKLSLYKINKDSPFERDECCWSTQTDKVDLYNEVYCFIKNNEKHIIVRNHLYKIIENNNNSTIKLISTSADSSKKEAFEKHNCLMAYGYDLYEQLCNEYGKKGAFVSLKPKSYKYPVFALEERRKGIKYIFVDSSGNNIDIGCYGDVEIFDDYLLVNQESTKISIKSLRDNLKVVREFDLQEYVEGLHSESVVEAIKRTNMSKYFKIHNLTEKDGVFYLSVCFGEEQGKWTFKLFVISEDNITIYPSKLNENFGNMKKVRYKSDVLQLNGIFMYIDDNKLYCFDPFENNSFEICSAEKIEYFGDGLFATILGQDVSVWDINGYNKISTTSFRPIIKFDVSYMNYFVDGASFAFSNGIKEYQIEQLKKKGAIFNV